MNGRREILSRPVMAGMLLAVLAAGCGSGDDPAINQTTGMRVISGTSAKGPLNDATIRVWQIDNRGQRVGGPLAETRTDTAGNWALSLPTGNQPLLVESSGGAYIDEADPTAQVGQRRTIQLGSDDTFAVLLPAGATTVAINIYTDALLRKSRYETQGANFSAVYAVNRNFFNSAFGFDITTTQPADPIFPAAEASISERQYAMALGGIANVVNALATTNQRAAPDFAIIAAVLDDMTDCTIDGSGVAGPLQGLTTITRNLNLEILRFRNNNFAVYQNTPLLEIDQAECSRSGLLPDAIAPVFSGLPDTAVVESPDGAGITVNAASVQTLLGRIQAIDDRDGAVTVSNNLPGFLPIGTTVVTFEATDLAGNAASVEWSITVASPQPPTITAPPDIQIRAGPELPVLVDLGTPIVSDNVSTVSELRVDNNAPGGGFPAGQFIVRWTVTDGIGLSAEAEQRVSIGVPLEGDGIVSNSDDRTLPAIPNDGFTSPVQPRSGRAGPARLPDGDLDGLPDIVELQLGSDVRVADTDRDSLDDALEQRLGSDPRLPSPVIHVPAHGGNRDFASATGAPGQPLVLALAEGFHDAPVTVNPPCDHLIVLGAGTGAALPALQFTGCRDVLIHHVDTVVLNARNAEVTLLESAVAGDRGAALVTQDSQLYLEASVVNVDTVQTDGSALNVGCNSFVAGSANDASLVRKSCH